MSNVVHDPGVSFGRFRVLQRSDRVFIVYDPTLPLGKRTVSVHRTLDAATEACRRADSESRGAA